MKQTRRNFLSTACAGVASAQLAKVARAAGGKPPNFLLIFLDDSGWSDFRPFGKTPYKTPHVEHLAAQGCSYKNFYVPQAICSASRSALLTGCYPGRTGITGALPPGAKGLDLKFATMGEIFKAGGYRTGIFGKWHIGDQPETRPAARGFEESCGLMYSNDMWEFHPENPQSWGPLRFWENGKVTIDRVGKQDQAMLTTWYTEHAVSFIRRNRDNPFLLYVPHSMPHVPLFTSKKFLGKSGTGVYGDVMMEIDWSVGEILKTLKQAGLEDNTLVFFSSDNGPWSVYGNHAGRTPFREAKGTGFDGGTRSACIMRYPNRIPAGSTSTQAFCTVDLLPTMASLADVKLPANPIDGANVWDIVANKPGAQNPHEYYPFSTNQVFEGVMSGDGHWKLHLPHDYRHVSVYGKDGMPGKYITQRIELSLFDMEHDPNETTNVIAGHPDVAARLEGYAEQHKREFYPAKVG